MLQLAGSKLPEKPAAPAAAGSRPVPIRATTNPLMGANRRWRRVAVVIGGVMKAVEGGIARGVFASDAALEGGEEQAGSERTAGKRRLEAGDIDQ